MSTALYPPLPWHTGGASLIGLLLALVCPAGAGGSEVQVAFRYDDFSAVSQTGFERDLIAVFDAAGVSLAVGVIPYACADVRKASPQDLEAIPSQKLQMLSEALARGTVEVLLHGYSHQTSVEVRPWTEFAGLPAQEQRRRLAEGRQLIETGLDTRISIFAPPWNSYDTTTLSVLDSLDFAAISADGTGPSGPSLDLQYLPVTCDLAHSRAAIERAAKGLDADPWILIGLHAYNFVEASDRGYAALPTLTELLRWIEEMDTVSVTSFTRLSTQRATSSRLMAHQQLLSRREALPTMLRGQGHRVYRSTAGSTRLAKRVRVAAVVSNVGIGVPVVLVLVALRRWLWRRKARPVGHAATID